MSSEQITMVKELCEVENGIWDKAVDFIEDLAKNPGMSLTEKQRAWLVRLHDKHVKGMR